MQKIYQQVKDWIIIGLTALGIYVVSQPKNEDIETIPGTGGNGGVTPPPVSYLPVFTINDISASMPLHPTKSYPYRNVGTLRDLVHHHSATTSGTAYIFANYHISEHDWPGIAYDYVIDKIGTIYKCKQIDQKGYHSGHPANDETMSVCFIGNYNYEVMPLIQMQAGAWLYRHLNQSPYIPFLGRSYHRDEMANRTCPGTNFPQAEYESIIDQYLNEI